MFLLPQTTHHPIVYVSAAILLLLLVKVLCWSFEHVLLSFGESTVGVCLQQLSFSCYLCVCRHLQDMKYINFYSFLHSAPCTRSLFSLSLSSSIYFVDVMTSHCPCVCKCVLSFHVFGSTLLFFYMHFICTWLHNNAQFHSAEIEYFGLNSRQLRCCRRYNACLFGVYVYIRVHTQTSDETNNKLYHFLTLHIHWITFIF